MLNQIAGSLLPVVLVVSLGYALGRGRLIGAEAQRGMNWLAYWVGLPCLLFLRSYTVDLGRIEALPVFIVLLAGMLLSGGVGWWLGGALCGLRGASRSVFVQACFRGNLLFAALPILIYSLEGHPPEWRDAVISDAVLALAPLIICYNLVAVLVLAAGRHTEERMPARQVASIVLGNPLILAIAAGLLCNALAWPLPVPVRRSLEVLDRLALPLALLAIGAHLSFVHAQALRKPAMVAAVIKVGIGPLAGVLLARALGLDMLQRHAVLIFLAAPTAASSYVLADQMKTDPDLAAGCVLVSTLLSVLSFGAVLAML